MVMNTLLRAAGDAAYRLGLGPRPSDVPDHTLVELVEGPGRLAPGRAFDLGCGTGRNALYLARAGWETVGVDMVGYAVEVARRKAAAQSLSIQFYQGDVMRLSELAVGTGFGLLMDGGCYHMIPADRRDAYAQSVTHVAAPGSASHHGRVQSHLGCRAAPRALAGTAARLVTRSGRSGTR